MESVFHTHKNNNNNNNILMYSSPAFLFACLQRTWHSNPSLISRQRMRNSDDDDVLLVLARMNIFVCIRNQYQGHRKRDSSIRRTKPQRIPFYFGLPLSPFNTIHKYRPTLGNGIHICLWESAGVRNEASTGDRQKSHNFSI